MNLFDIFATPKLCEIRFLSEFPPNTDPSTWKQITWPNYQPLMHVVAMEMVPDQGGLIFVKMPFVVTDGFYIATCYGVLLDGQCMFVGQFDPSLTVQIGRGANIFQFRAIFFLSKFS